MRVAGDRPVFARHAVVGDLVEAWQRCRLARAQCIEDVAGERHLVRAGRAPGRAERMDATPERLPGSAAEVEVVDRQRDDVQAARGAESRELGRERRLAGALQPGDGVDAGVVRNRVVEDACDEGVGVAGSAGVGRVGMRRCFAWRRGV